MLPHREELPHSVTHDEKQEEGGEEQKQREEYELPWLCQQQQNVATTESMSLCDRSVLPHREELPHPVNHDEKQEEGGEE